MYVCTCCTYNIGISYRHADSLYTDNLDVALPSVSSLMLAPIKAIGTDTLGTPVITGAIFIYHACSLYYMQEHIRT